MDQYKQELCVGKLPQHRVRLVILGDPGVGKSQLSASLSRSRLKSLFRPHPPPSSEPRPLVMSVGRMTFPVAGEFNVWEMSGQTDLQRTHECFIGSPCSIYLVVYRLTDPPHVQCDRLRHWLGLLKSQHAPLCGFAGRTSNNLHVVLVGSFADQESADSAHSLVIGEFEQWFNIDTHCLDCRVVQTTKRLRESLAALRLKITQVSTVCCVF